VGNYYFIGQWFPKLGVFEDGVWNTHQFHAATEFFADFGVYDVRVTLPRGFVVGASGRHTSRTDNPDGTTTHWYRGEDIHDFAWTASPDFVDLSQRFEHPTLPAVEMRLLLQPERRSQAARYFAVVAATLKRYGEWFGAYPYGHVTIVDPAFQSESDGMEYPTLFTGRSRWLAPPHVQTPEATTAHEAGHQWWYGMVASNEFEHAWMDEGINTYATARVLDEAFNPNRVERRYLGGFVPWTFRNIPFTRVDNDRITAYRLNAEADAPWTPTFRYWPATASIVTYNKTALWLHTLERRLGWPMMQRILATYFERWKFKHPKPADFFDVVREVSGQGHVWFFDEVYRSSNTFDYGVQALRSDRQGENAYRTTVVAARFGEAVFPVDVVTTFEDGQRIKETWDGQDRRVIYVYERPTQAVSVHVDPERVLLLDVNVTNNSRTLKPRDHEASLKWSLTWMVWLQDLMLTYGFFL
jgi:aminopeptidase N